MRRNTGFPRHVDPDRNTRFAAAPYLRLSKRDAVIVPSVTWIGTTDTENIDIEMTQDLGKEFVNLLVLYDGVQYDVNTLRVIAYEIDLDTSVPDAQEATAPGQFLPLDPEETSISDLTPFTLDVSDSEIWTTYSIIEFNPPSEYEHVSLFAQVGDLVGSSGGGSGGSGGSGGAPEGYFNVAWDSPYTLGTVGTLTLYARGDSPSETSGDTTITVTGDAWKSPSGGTDSNRLTEPVSDTVVATVIAVDLDVDSNNDAGPTGGPDFSLTEDNMEEDSPGKIIESWIGNDDDHDLIPDFADGYNFDESLGTADDEIDPLQSGFVPMVVTLPPGVVGSTAKLRFTYTPSPPGSVQTSTETVPHTGVPPEEITLYSPAAGDLRIWKKDAGAQRTIANDYVELGTWYTASDVTDLYVEGIDPGETTVTVELDPTGGSGPLTDDTVLFTVVKLDIDVDSDNNDTLNRSALEDAIEDRDGNGVGQVGKRVFINMDDDNKNGEPDHGDSKPDYLRHDLHDKDFAETKLDAAAVDGLQGYSLWLGVPTGSSAWGDDQKTYLRDVADPPDGGINVPWDPYYNAVYGTWYYWNIGAEGVSFPATVFVERWTLNEAKVFWRLVEPGGSGANNGDVVERDTVEVNAEWAVWPNQDPSAEWDPGENTLQWNGFRLAPGWYIQKSLGQIINGSIGYIRTEYPEETETGQWEGTGNQNSNATLDLAELCGTEEWEDAVTVRIEVTYAFEQSPNITVGQFVDTTYSKYKEGFFHNSGVKIENCAEIQIYDTASLLDAIDNGHDGIIEGNSVTISHDPGNDIETGEVLLRHTGSQSGDWLAESVNALITGIPYAATPKPSGITYREWLDSAPTGGHTMIIDVSRGDDDKYDFSVKIDEDDPIEYSDISPSGTPDPGMLYLQSHWGGGVTFTSAKVKKL